MLSFSDIILFEFLPCFVLVEVVDNEEVGNVLSLGHSEPVGSARVRVNERSEIIEFVLYDP